MNALTAESFLSVQSEAACLSSRLVIGGRRRSARARSSTRDVCAWATWTTAAAATVSVTETAAVKYVFLHLYSTVMWIQLQWLSVFNFFFINLTLKSFTVYNPIWNTLSKKELYMTCTSKYWVYYFITFIAECPNTTMHDLNFAITFC